MSGQRPRSGVVDVGLRLATASDAEAIAEIYNQAVRAGFQTAELSPVSVASRLTWLAAHPPDAYPVWVLEEAGQVLGWCSLSAYRPGRAALRHTAEISYYVHQAHRRKGVATRLTRHALAACPSLGLEVVYAVLLDVNEASVALLEREGFERWGHLPGVARIGEVVCGQWIYGRRVN